MIATPHDLNGLHHTFERVEGDYARALHIRLHRRGHLWQGRFRSAPMDEKHFWAAMVYVEQNPVRAHLVEAPRDWRWSSARAHLDDRPGSLLDFAAWRRRFTPELWSQYLSLGVAEASLLERVREATRIGRPAAEESFLRDLQQQLGRPLLPGKPGRPRKSVTSARGETPTGSRPGSA